MISSLDGHLRDVAIPRLADSTIVVFASRLRPSVGWFDAGWDWCSSRCRSTGSRRASSDRWVLRTVSTKHRSKHSFRSLTDHHLRSWLGRNRTGWFGSRTGCSTARQRGRPRVTSHAERGSARPSDDARAPRGRAAGHRWSRELQVARRPLVQRAARGWHRFARPGRGLGASGTSRQDPVGEATLRRRIADHVYERARQGNSRSSADLQHLVVDPDVRWGFSADIGSRYRIDEVRDGDVEHIGGVLHAVGLNDWWDVTSVFFREHPEFVGVARDGQGGVGGYYVAVSPGNAPEAAERVRRSGRGCVTYVKRCGRTAPCYGVRPST